MTTYKKLQILSPEDISLNTLYTLTISPDDNLQMFRRVNRCELFNNWFISQFKQYHENDFDIVLCKEVSRTGRLHWHGTIYFKCYLAIKQFYVDLLPELLNHNQVEIDTIEDISKWKLYVEKQQKVMDMECYDLKDFHELYRSRILKKEIEMKNKKFSDYNIDED